VHGIPEIQNKELVKNADLKSDLRGKRMTKREFRKKADTT